MSEGNVLPYPVTILNHLEPVLAAAHKSLSMGFALVDRKMRFCLVNDALARMNRVAAKTHVGTSLRTILGSTADKVEPVYEKVFSTGKAELHYAFSGGTPRRREEVDWILSLFPVASTCSIVKQVAAVVLDMTSIRRLGTLMEELCHTSPFPSSGTISHSLPLQNVSTESGLSVLTIRELETLKLLASGNGNKQVASALTISVRTVESHRARIMLKLKIKSVSELVRFAIRAKLVEE